MNRQDIPIGAGESRVLTSQWVPQVIMPIQRSGELKIRILKSRKDKNSTIL